MQQYDEDYTVFEGNNNGDEKLFVKFFDRPVILRGESEKAGRPIHGEVPHISIRTPGATEGIVRAATEADKNRFPRHFAAFEGRRELPVEGTILAEWPMIPRTLVKDLEFVDVKTVEQLVAMRDTDVQRFVGLSGYREKAKLFLEQAAGGAPLHRLQAELDERDIRISAQDQTIKALSERLSDLEGAAQTDKAAEPETMDEPAADVPAATAAAPRRSRKRTA